MTAESTTLTLETGLPVTLELRRSPRAARMTLKVDPITERAVVSLPLRGSMKRAVEFAEGNAGFIAKQMAGLPPWIAFQPDTAIPFCGNQLVIRHNPTARRGVWLQGDDLKVSGQDAHLPRRVQDWLKRQARSSFTPRLQDYRDKLGCPKARLRLGDPTSRWGSCSTTGTISLSWRLICAPRDVQDYVLAHEAAHLIEPHHGASFWRLVEDLVGAHDAQKAWLKRNGLQLHRMGVRPD